MTLDELRSGFFGYQKASVYRYITSLEEQFSSKLVEKDAAAKRAAEQYQEKINQLEQELQAVREQCETQKNEQMVIAHTLLDAQRYAEQMKQESAQKQQEAQRCLDEQVAEKNRELERYRSQVQELRKLFLSMLKEMDGTASQLEEKIQTVQADCPDQNLALFHRKAGPVA